MINPYIVVHTTQPEPHPKSAAALEADAKAAAARVLALCCDQRRCAWIKLQKKHGAGKFLRAGSKAFNWVVDLLAENELGFPDREEQTPAGSGYRFVLQLARTLNHIDGHEDKFLSRAPTLPSAFSHEERFRSAGGGLSLKLPSSETPKLRDHISDLLRRGCPPRRDGRQSLNGRKW